MLGELGMVLIEQRLKDFGVHPQPLQIGRIEACKRWSATVKIIRLTFERRVEGCDQEPKGVFYWHLHQHYADCA
jgi:hypothetical protein